LQITEGEAEVIFYFNNSLKVDVQRVPKNESQPPHPNPYLFAVDYFVLI
jgi:hypothetical protein